MPMRLEASLVAPYIPWHYLIEILSEKELRSIEEYFAWRFDSVYDPDRSQTIDLEDSNSLDTEGDVAFVLG
jgi:hypothetical protein